MDYRLEHLLLAIMIEIDVRFYRAENMMRYGTEDPTGGGNPQPWPLNKYRREF